MKILHHIMGIKFNLKTGMLCHLLGASFVFFWFSSCINDPNSESDKKQEVEAAEIEYNIPNDFTLDILFRPKQNGFGSWVALAEGTKGNFYAADQHGGIYQFTIPANGSKLDPSQIDSIALPIGHAQGLLWAFNSLYVSVNDRWKDEEGNVLTENGSGIYRLRDLDGDGILEDMKMLLRLDGAGEHGPHNLILSPDKQRIFFVAGNHTKIPSIFLSHSRLPPHWGEDQLFPPFLDARGHANDIKAPGGWVASFDPEGLDWELVGAGFRNPYDIAFNQDGELFTFDSDMEWDIGMPWYRPIRICHIISGSEFGWRTGSGKWPDYYPDNLPPVANLNQGSPTAVLSTSELKLPSEYQNGLIVFDWSFGTAYFVELLPKGSTYQGKVREFFSGSPLPLTDAVAASDGSMYFASGGRNLDSYFYRLRYTGVEIGNPLTREQNNAESLRKLRKTLENYHQPASIENIPLVWENIGHNDRFIRYAARVALEHQTPKIWINFFRTETNHEKIIQGAIALAKIGESQTKKIVYQKLRQVAWDACTPSQKLSWLRALGLSVIRLGEPELLDRQHFVQQLASEFPSTDIQLNRELSQLLIYFADPNATTICLELLVEHSEQKTNAHPSLLSEEISQRSEQYGPTIVEVLQNMPPTEAIFYGSLLSHAQKGWTKADRERYFTWFYDGLNAKGGMSFKPFLENIRKRAMMWVPDSLKNYFEELTGVYQPGEELANLPQPRGPGKDYTASEINKILRKRLKKYKANVSDGKTIYEAALCATCHRMRGQGGNAGPDLTQLHTRFKQGEIITAIFSPNDEISDQYGFTLFHKSDGKKISGKVLRETDNTVFVAPNPFTTNHIVEIEKSNILRRTPSPLSPMPANLLNRLNEEEITDLFAYLLSGGNRKHYFYGGKKGKRLP